MKNMRAFVWLFAFCATIFVGLSTVQGQDQSAKSAVKLYKEGLALYKQRDWKAALQKFESAVFSQPGMEQALYCAGLCHLLEGNVREAIKYEKNLVELQSKFTGQLSEAINKRLPDGNQGRLPGHLPKKMKKMVDTSGLNVEEVDSLSVPSEEDTNDKVNAAALRLLKEQEENGDDPDCAASRQAVANGILAFFQQSEKKTSIFKKDIERMIARAGMEKEEPDESEVVSNSELNGKKVRMYKNRSVKLWIEPLITEKLICPLGGSYIVEQDGRTFKVHCSKHDGPCGTIEAPENCEPTTASTMYSEFLIPSSY